MTTDTSTQQPAEAPGDAPAGTPAPAAPASPSEAPSDKPQEDAGPPKAGANSEAARYRTERNEARAEADTLRGRVDTLLRREAERLAAAVLAQGGDLFDVGRADLAELLDEAGDVDPDKVATAAKALAASRPGLKAPNLWPSMGAGAQGQTPTAGSTSWSEVLNPHRHAEHHGPTD